MYNPVGRFSDLTETLRIASSGDPYAQKPNYFPVVYLCLYWLRAWNPARLVRAFLILNAGLYPFVCVVGCLAVLGRSARGLGAGLLYSLLVLAAYPLLLALDRANVEAIMGALELASMILLYVDRPWAAALALALAVSFKGYPGLLCAAFAARGRLKQGVCAILMGLALDLAAIHGLAGGFLHNWTGFMAGLVEYREFYVLGFFGMHYCADPYNGLRALAYWIVYDLPSLLVITAPLFWCVHHYLLFSFTGLMATSAYALFARGAPFHRRLLAAVLGTILFPYTAFDYKLVTLFSVPLFMAVEARPWSDWDRVSAACLLALLVPKNYFFMYGDVSLSCVVSPLLMLSLLAGLASDRPAWAEVLAGLKALRRSPRRAWARLNAGPEGC